MGKRRLKQFRSKLSNDIHHCNVFRHLNHDRYLVADILYAVVDPRISYKKNSMATEIKQDYWSYVKDNSATIKERCILLHRSIYGIRSLICRFLANEKPIYCQYKGNRIFPFLEIMG